MKKRLLAILSIIACMSIGFTSPLNSMSAMATGDEETTDETGDTSEDADSEDADAQADDVDADVYEDEETADSSDTDAEYDEEEQLVNSYSGLIDEFADVWFTGKQKNVDNYMLKNEIMYSMYGGSFTFEYDVTEEEYQSLVEKAGEYVGDGDAKGELSDDSTNATVSKVIKCKNTDLLFTVNHSMVNGKVTFTVSTADDAAAATGDSTEAASENEDAESGDFGKAGLNTLMGMGTVFMVLIFISFIIALFALFSKFGKKPAVKEEVKAAPAPAPVVAAPQAASNDDEIAAVIAAAIAAYEADSDVYEVPADGLYVRSIKKRGFC